MAVLIYAESLDGVLKKPAFEAASYGYALAKREGLPLYAVCVGAASTDELKRLQAYGVTKVFHVAGSDFDKFNDAIYASAIAAAARPLAPKFIVFSHSANGKAISGRLAIKLGYALIPGATELISAGGQGYQVRRTAYSGKAIESVTTAAPNLIVSVKPNAFNRTENPASEFSVENVSYQASDKEKSFIVKEIIKSSDEISLTEADVVVSGGRGLKGPENWGMMEELAHLLNAGKACSKPVADVEWRPHHEHVGQTGVQIAPNVYIAVGISGAIQHLAGVNSSKTIIVINKDADAPFFKAADYGIIGDAFEVVPELIKSIKAYKHN